MNKDVLKKSSTIFSGIFFTASILNASVVYALSFSVTPKAGTSLPVSVPYGGMVYAYYTLKNETSMARYGNVIQGLPLNVEQVTSAGFYPDTCGSTFDLAASGTSGDSCTLQLIIKGAVNGMPNPFVCFASNSPSSCVGTDSPLNVTVDSPVSYTWTDTGLSNSTYVADIAAALQISQLQLYAGGLQTDIDGVNAGQLWSYIDSSTWTSQFTTPIANSRVTALIPNTDTTQLYMAEGNIGYGDVATFTPGDSASTSICSAYCAEQTSTINDLSLGNNGELYATGGAKTFPVVGDVWHYLGNNNWESTGLKGYKLAAGFWLNYVASNISSVQSPSGLYVASYTTPEQSDTPVVYIYNGSPAVWSNTYLPYDNIDVLQSLNVDANGIVYATGSSAVSGISRGALLSYSQGIWQSIATPPDSESISTMTFLNGVMVIGGENLKHQGAIWISNGAGGWTNTRLTNSEEITSLNVYNGKVYAGGYNDNIGKIWSLLIQ